MHAPCSQGPLPFCRKDMIPQHPVEHVLQPYHCTLLTCFSAFVFYLTTATRYLLVHKNRSCNLFAKEQNCRRLGVTSGSEEQVGAVCFTGSHYLCLPILSFVCYHVLCVQVKAATQHGPSVSQKCRGVSSALSVM